MLKTLCEKLAEEIFPGIEPINIRQFSLTFIGGVFEMSEISSFNSCPNCINSEAKKILLSKAQLQAVNPKLVTMNTVCRIPFVGCFNSDILQQTLCI